MNKRTMNITKLGRWGLGSPLVRRVVGGSMSSFLASVYSMTLGITTFVVLAQVADGVAADWGILATVVAAQAALMSAPRYLRDLRDDSNLVQQCRACQLAAATIAGLAWVLLADGPVVSIDLVPGTGLALARTEIQGRSLRMRASGEFSRSAWFQGPTVLGSTAVLIAVLLGTTSVAMIATISAIFGLGPLLVAQMSWGTAVSVPVVKSDSSGMKERKLVALAGAIAIAGYPAMMANTELWFLVPRLQPIDADLFAVALRITFSADIVIGAVTMSFPYLVKRAEAQESEPLGIITLTGAGLAASLGVVSAASVALGFWLSSVTLMATGAVFAAKAVKAWSGPSAFGLALTGRERSLALAIVGAFGMKALILWWLAVLVDPLWLFVGSAAHSAVFSVVLSLWYRSLVGVDLFGRLPAMRRSFVPAWRFR